MRYMTTPKYHRDRRIPIAILPQDGYRSLTVSVVGDRVELSSAGYWSCLGVGPLVEAINKAATVAAQWSNRDRALAEVMDRREYNSGFWMPAVREATQRYLGELATTRTEAEIRAGIEDAISNCKGARGFPAVIPRLHIQFDGTCLTVEPLWDEIEEFRWVEPDAS